LNLQKLNRLKKPGFLFIVFFTLFITSFSAYPQINKVPNLKLYDYDPIHFGFIIAANEMNFTIETKDNLHQLYFKDKQLPQGDLPIYPVDSAMIYSIDPEPTLGFTVGIVGDLRLGNYFNFKAVPSLAFGSRILNYDIRLLKDGDTSSFVSSQKINSTFVDFPFYLKYKSKRLRNMRAYVFGGIKFSFDLASQANKQEENNYEPKLLRSDTYGLIGAGVDIYMNWFKFGLEFNMSYGLRDILLREDNIYTGGIKSLRSKIFMLTFTFE